MNNIIEKDLAWLPKPLVEKIKSIDDPISKECEKLIDEYIDSSKKEFKQSLDNLDEDLIQYQSMMIKTKNKFKEAKEEQVEASYALWEKFEDELPSVEKKTKKIIAKLQPLKEELTEIDDIIKSIQTYDIQKLVEMIKFFNSNIYGETENILKYLIDNYRSKK